MVLWFIILVIVLGIAVLRQALKHSYEQWYYGRLNRRTLEAWRNEHTQEGGRR